MAQEDVATSLTGLRTQRLRLAAHDGSTHDRTLVVAMGQITRALAAPEPFAEATRVTLQQAEGLIACAEHASLCVELGRDHQFQASSPTAESAHRLQRELGDGPTLAALRDGRLRLLVAAEPQAAWAKYASGVAALGVGSELAVPMRGQGMVGVLTLYAKGPRPFHDEDCQDVSLLAEHAAAVLTQGRLLENLRTAVASNRFIGQAVGVLMERHKLTESEAFGRLVDASQRRHIKLRDIATRIIESGEEPDRA